MAQDSYQHFAGRTKKALSSHPEPTSASCSSFLDTCGIPAAAAASSRGVWGPPSSLGTRLLVELVIEKRITNNKNEQTKAVCTAPFSSLSDTLQFLKASPVPQVSAVISPSTAGHLCLHHLHFQAGSVCKPDTFEPISLILPDWELYPFIYWLFPHLLMYFFCIFVFIRNNRLFWVSQATQHTNTLPKTLSPSSLWYTQLLLANGFFGQAK